MNEQKRGIDWVGKLNADDITFLTNIDTAKRVEQFVLDESHGSRFKKGRERSARGRVNLNE